MSKRDLLYEYPLWLVDWVLSLYIYIYIYIYSR
jgi:hypothetical protein